MKLFFIGYAGTKPIPHKLEFIPIGITRIVLKMKQKQHNAVSLIGEPYS